MKSDAWLKVALYACLTLLLGAGAVMLHRAPVRGYVVTCERKSEVACTLEQERSTGVQRWEVPLDSGASAVVRVVQQRRGNTRVLLYLETPARAIFAAEFEGGDAADAATRAAHQLNRVLRGTTSGTARVEATPPPLLGWLAWGALGIMGLLIVTGFRDALRRRAAA